MSYNQSIGSKTEKEFARFMSARGYWVYLLPNTQVGQPFDVVVAKGEDTWFFDVKHVKGKDYIVHSRFEVNQLNTFQMMQRRNISRTGFVIKFFEEDGFYILWYKDIDFTQDRTYKNKMVKLP